MIGFQWQLQQFLILETIGSPRYKDGNWDGRHPNIEEKLMSSRSVTPIPKILLLEKLTFNPDTKYKQLKIREWF